MNTRTKKEEALPPLFDIPGKDYQINLSKKG